MKNFIFAFILSFSGLSLAEETQKFECDFKTYNFENVDVQITPKCSISVNPGWGMEIQGRKRSYTFSEDGFLMVYVSTQDSPRNSQRTGSNSYFLRPATLEENKLEYSFDKDIHVLTLITAYGIKVEIDTRNAHILNIEGYRLETRPLTHIPDLAKNNGHISLTAFDDNILFDHGWRLGEVSIAQLSRRATVTKGNSKKCTIKNSDVLKKEANGSGEVFFTLDNYDESLNFYKKKC